MIVEDSILGVIKLQVNSRAKKITARYRNGLFSVSYPYYLSEGDILQAIEKMRPRLLELKNKSLLPYVFTEDTKFKTLTFEVVIQKKALNNTYTSFQNNFLYITFPEGEDVREESNQLYIRGVIEILCRSEAKKILPARVRKLAGENKFEVNSIKINNSRGRWGSCSSKKNINLSYFCMMLPIHLIDYVILHELCHTIEMNHGDNFWKLLDRVTGDKAKILSDELKKFKLNW